MSNWLRTASAVMIGACALAGGVSRAEAYTLVDVYVSGYSSNVIVNGNLQNTSALQTVSYIAYLPTSPDENFQGSSSYQGLVVNDDGYGSGYMGPTSISLGVYDGSTTFLSYSTFYLYSQTPIGFGNLPRMTYFVKSSDMASLSFSYGDFSGNQASVSFRPIAIGINQPPVLPLPSTAPLFGAALLALAGSGWGARRRQAQ